MRKTVTAVGAAILLSSTWTIAAGPEEYSPEARAYVGYAFGAPRAQALKTPSFRYGLRLDVVQTPRYYDGYGNFLTPLRADAQPSLLGFEGNSRGDAIAALNGVPFAAHIAGLSEEEGGGAPAAEGGFTWFDWGLLAVGIGGVGYGIYRATKGKDSPDPAPNSSGGGSSGGTTGGLLGGLLGGTSGGSSGGATGGLLGGLLGGTSGGSTTGGTTGGLLGGLLGGTTTGGFRSLDAGSFERPSPEHQQWLDGGTGHMGDIGG